MRYGKALAALMLISAGGLLVFRGVREYLGSQQSQREIADSWRDESALPDIPGKSNSRDVPPGVPSSLNIPRGAAFSHLEIPRLHTSLYVVEGSDAESLKKGPGHVRGSAMPGQPGNCVIAGHRDLHFRALKDIETGDQVYVQTAQGRFRYRVTSTRIITPQQIEVLQPTKDAELHLITCYPFYFLGHAPKRFVVTAQLETTVQIPTAGLKLPVVSQKTSIRRTAAVKTHVRRRPIVRAKLQRARALGATRALNLAAAGDAGQ